MKKAFLFGLVGTIVLLFVSSGCKLVTQESDPPLFRPAGHLIINEVLTLPLSHPGYYCWIEFFNPTLDTIDATGWTLTMHTQRNTQSIEATITIDSAQNVTFLGAIFLVTLDSIGIFDVPFGEGLFSQPGIPPPAALILPGRLLTITSNESRMEDHTGWGPAQQGIQRERGSFQGPIYQIDTLFVRLDPVNHVDTLGFRVLTKSYSFLIRPDDQLVLKDPSGKVTDVVRIGNHTTYQPVPFTDPMGLLGAQNRPISVPPQFKSVSRFAEAYFTGNTETDFFITDDVAPPIPGGYSQRRKQ